MRSDPLNPIKADMIDGLDPDSYTTIWHLQTSAGASDTIRVQRHDADWYVVQMLRPSGWTHLLFGSCVGGFGPLNSDEVEDAVIRSAAILLKNSVVQIDWSPVH